MHCTFETRPSPGDGNGREAGSTVHVSVGTGQARVHQVHCIGLFGEHQAAVSADIGVSKDIQRRSVDVDDDAGRKQRHAELMSAFAVRVSHTAFGHRTGGPVIHSRTRNPDSSSMWGIGVNSREIANSCGCATAFKPMPTKS